MRDLLKEMRALDPNCRGLLVRAYQTDATVAQAIDRWKNIDEPDAVSFASCLSLIVSILVKQNAALRIELANRPQLPLSDIHPTIKEPRP